MAGVECAMQSRAKVGLVWLSLAAAPLAFAHAAGVTHTYENGSPVITVRLVPSEEGISKTQRINALDPAAAEAAPVADAHTGEMPTAIGQDAAEAAPEGGYTMPLNPEPANEIPASEESADIGPAAAARFPSARPVLKPNTETGIGGALDLAPPTAETPQPRPMRLNSVQRPRSVAERAQRPAREQRVRQPRVRAETARPAEPDPLDEALPPRVIDAPRVNAMQLPPVKMEERIAGQ
jgi:hypothetical protein